MIKCPLCQQIISFMNDKSIVCSNCCNVLAAPYFKIYIENGNIISYGSNIIINEKLYGLDSYKPHCRSSLFGWTKIIVRNDTHSSWESFYQFNDFTPIPSNKQNFEKFIQRIINLKAFL